MDNHHLSNITKLKKTLFGAPSTRIMQNRAPYDLKCKLYVTYFGVLCKLFLNVFLNGITYHLLIRCFGFFSFFYAMNQQCKTPPTLWNTYVFSQRPSHWKLMPQ